jgi:hypothetical protein
MDRPDPLAAPPGPARVLRAAVGRDTHTCRPTRCRRRPGHPTPAQLRRVASPWRYVGSAVVSHRWPIAAGLDERALVWQVVEARLPARHGRYMARRRARDRRARWRRRRYVRCVGRACAWRRDGACTRMSTRALYRCSAEHTIAWVYRSGSYAHKCALWWCLWRLYCVL